MSLVVRRVTSWQRGLCDDTLRLFANIPPGPDGNYIFNWSGPNGFNSNEENPVIPGSDSSSSGIYVLTVVSQNGCTSTGSVSVEIETLLSPQITIEDDTVCIGEEILLQTQTYSGMVTYQWYEINEEGDTIIHTTPDPEFLFTASEAGTYVFYAVVIQDTCMSAPGNEVSVTVYALPEVAIAAIALPLCVYDTLFLSPENVVDSLSYLWTGPGGFISTDPVPGGIPVAEIDTPFIFYLTASNAFCSSIADSVVIDIQETPLTPSITGESVACEGGMIMLTSTTIADQYLWIDPAFNTILTSFEV